MSMQAAFSSWPMARTSARYAVRVAAVIGCSDPKVCSRIANAR